MSAASTPPSRDLYSVVCVRDRATSQKWFEVFFGRPADEVIGEEYLWQVGANAWVVIDDRSVRAARVGGAMITLGVTGLSDILARLAAHGIEHEPAETMATACTTWKSSTRTATACRSRRCPPGSPGTAVTRTADQITASSLPPPAIGPSAEPAQERGPVCSPRARSRSVTRHH